MPVWRCLDCKRDFQGRPWSLKRTVCPFCRATKRKNLVMVSRTMGRNDRIKPLDFQPIFK